MHFYQVLAQTLQKNSVVLATVVKTKGSVPREIGAKMLISSDGKTFDTIGGGAGEAKVYQQALQVLQTGEKQFVEIDLSGASHSQTQGVCGGTMLVWLELWSGYQALELVKQILKKLTLEQTAVLITPFTPDQKPYLTTTQTLNSPLILRDQAFIELLSPPPKLLISGAGHIAIPLSQIAKIAGFQVIVQDDRPDFATNQRFPEAAIVLAKPIIAIQEILNNVSDLYVALVTRSYVQDLTALRLILNYQPKYIGMIGSEKRVHTVYKILQTEGYSEKLLQQIYAPIGLDIGAFTPEEIAVSICAELIKVRRGGSGLSLSIVNGQLSIVKKLGNHEVSH
ncbi:XdhC/CoxI family protein [Fischerella sp. JS2]|uniref:XdhC family protein n=1 Tax=Fischerella sp. JS2 TaxID=2597771 RepID=UPI0028EC364E|nr:XdhC/CoxI family protein [Fischerella sp. JS2]